MYHVSVTFLSVTFCIRMEFHFSMYGVSRRRCYIRVTYVWHMKHMRDISMAYLPCSPRKYHVRKSLTRPKLARNSESIMGNFSKTSRESNIFV